MISSTPVLVAMPTLVHIVQYFARRKVIYDNTDEIVIPFYIKPKLAIDTKPITRAFTGWTSESVFGGLETLNTLLPDRTVYKTVFRMKAISQQR